MGESDTHLKELIFAILDEREKALELNAEAIKLRLEHLNSLREEYLQDRSEFVKREIYNEMLRRMDRLESQYSKLIGIGIALAALSWLFGIALGHYWK